VEYWYLILLDSVSISHIYGVRWRMKKLIAEAREKRRRSSYKLYKFITRGRVILLLLVSLVFNWSQRNTPIQNLEKVLVKEIRLKCVCLSECHAICPCIQLYIIIYLKTCFRLLSCRRYIVYKNDFFSIMTNNFVALNLVLCEYEI
jgi:hypothetical protein